MKVPGIIYTVLSTLSTLTLLAAILSGMSDRAGKAVAFLGLVLALPQPTPGIVMGVVRLMNCDKPEKAGPCLILGGAVSLLGGVGLVGNVVAGALSATVMGSLIGRLISVLCTVGAFLNQRAAKVV